MDNANHLHPVAQIFSIPSSVSVIEGESTLEHLNRLVSIDTLGLHMLGRRDGLLCNANGRILDIATVCNLDGQVIIIGNQDTGNDTRQILSSGIPWNEELIVKDADDAISHLLLIGKAPQRCLAGLGIDPTELSDERWLEFGNCLLSIHWGSPEAIQILVPTTHHDSLVTALIENGAQHANSEQWYKVRIICGILNHNELNSDNLPFELGLENLVALDKGCYPGQEIHARMESRGALARLLVRLKSSNLIPIGKSKIENVGSVTVTDACQYDGQYFALALLPHAAAEIDSINFGDGITAKVESI
tara:strand:- start:2299 stop:3210 length:912 start_codon:yes stop_codon:yes gene_type:complete